MKVRLATWLPLLAGGVIVLIGALWLLQGSDLIHIDPVACVGDCAPVNGRNTGWQVAGAITLLVGGTIIAAAVRRVRSRVANDHR